MIGKLLAVGLLCAGMAMGQAPAVSSASKAPVAPVAVPAKSLAFDVISIRKNTSQTGPQMGPPQFGPTPDGYRMTGVPLAMAIMSAYPPQAGGGTLFTPDRIKGLPDWAMRDRYDINAKVAEEDLPEWQKPAAQTAMMQAMLQALLVERCKIVVHRESKDSQVYLLVVGKNGPKFKETDPAATHPAGITLPGGGTLVPSNNGGISMYGTSMGMLATILSSMGGGQNLGRPVQDKTGLTGRYDIVMRPDMGPRPDGAGGGGQFDPTEMVFTMVDSLGLKLESGKSSVETLVVDHIDPPSED